MALSLGDLFPLRGSRRAAVLSRLRTAGRAAGKRHPAVARPSALAFETYEPRMLLSADTFAGYTVATYLDAPVIGAGLAAEVTGAVDLVDDVAQQANGSADFADVLDTEIPGLLERDGIFQAKDFEAPTLGDVLDNADVDFTEITGAIVDLFDDASLGVAGTPAGLATALEALSADLGDGVTLQVNLLDADPDTAGVQSYRVHALDADSFELLYNIEVLVTVTDPEGDTYRLDLGRNADALEVDYAADRPDGAHLPAIKLSSSYRVETVFGVSADVAYDNDLDDDGNIEEDASDFGVVVTPTGAFLRDPSFEAGVSADASTSAIPLMQFGFLDVKALAGTANFDMHVEVGFSGTISSAGDLTAPTVETGGSIEVLLPITVDPSGVLGGDGFSGASPVVRLYSDNPFDAVHASIPGSDDGRTAISIQLQDFDTLDPFRNIDAGGLANVFSGLGTMLEQLQAKTQLFGLTLPVVDSTKVSDLLAFDGPMKTLYDALTVERNGAIEANFVNVQDFVSKLQTALNAILATYNTNPDFDDVAALVGINPRYEFISGTPTLRFNIDLRSNASDAELDLQGDLGLDLSPVGQVALEGSLAMDAAFAVQLTLGIELVEPPNVGVVTVSSPSALVGRVVNGDIAGTEDVEFSLVLGGLGSVRVTLANQNYGSAGGLASALEGAIADAISDAIDSDLLPTPAPDVAVTVNAQGRLVMTSAGLPYLQILNRGDASAFAGLGFLDGQRASVSRLPADGQLSGTASFDLTIGATTHTITLTAAATAGNAEPEDLVASLNAVIAGQFGAGTYATLVGDETEGDVVGRRIQIASGQAFVRVDAANAVAKAELGLQDDAVSSKLLIRGDASIYFDANDPASPLPANGNAGAVSFTVTLTQGGVSSGAIAVAATLAGNGLDAQGHPLTAAQAAIEAAQDLNDALATTTLVGDQKLSSVLVASPFEFRNGDGTGNGQWGIRFIQPAATVDTTLAFAFADAITIAGIAASENIGIADGTSNRSGPALADTLGGDASFTINLSDSAGAVTQQAITLDDGAITNTLAGVVDALNAAIGGGALAGKVVVGLEGARLVFAVTDPNATVIELSSVNAIATDDLGLQEGISARTFEGVQAFVEDIHLDASLAVDGSASGSANFGFVALDLGTATVALDAQVDVDVANKIYLRDLFHALGSPLDATIGLIALMDGDADGDIVGLGGEDEEIDLHGSASVEWDGLALEVAGSGGVADDLSGELGEVASPFIHVTLDDITDLSSLDVDADLGSLADLANFDFDDALAALRAIADWLQAYTAQLDILNEPLPLLGISLADTLAFVDDFTQAVEDIADNPTDNLQSLLDKVNEGLQQFVGPAAHIGYVANSPGILTFDLQFERAFSDILPLEIDMVALLEDEVGINVPGLELNGAANLAASFGFEAELVFGVDVAALSAAIDDPVHTADDVLDAIFLVVEDDDAEGIDGYTHLSITGFASAENVTFTGALGPLGIFVTNGGAVLNKTGVFGDTSPAGIAIALPDLGPDDGYLTLGDFFDAGNLAEIFNPDNVQVDLGVAAVLPVSFPTSSSFIGNLDFSALVTDPFGDGGVTYTLNSIPDFSQIDLSNLGLLDTINLFLAGADTVLGTLGDLITGEVFGADALAGLPLVGDALSDAGAFIDQIRNEVIPQITNIIETAPELLTDIFAQIGGILQDALSTLSFLGSSVKLNLLDADGNVFKTYDFDPVVSAAAGYFAQLADDVFAADGFSYALDLAVDLHLQPADVNLDLEVFQLQLTDPITVDIAADLTFGIGVSLADGFFFQVNPDGVDDLSGSITIDLPSEVDAQLFFLQLTATNNNAGVRPDLEASFSVDLLGTDGGRIGFGDISDLDFDVDFGAQVDLDMLFALGVANTDGIGLPKILADFDFAWGFGDSVDTDHPDTPLLSLGDIRLDIGSFLNGTIGPFIQDLYDVLEPIDPLLDILTDPIPVLSDLLGPTSLLDVAATFGIVNPGLVTALELLDQVVDFAATLSDSTGGYVTIFADTLTFGGGGMDLTDMNQVGALTDPSKALTAVLSELDSLGLGLPGELTDALGFIASGFAPGDLPGAPSDMPDLGGPEGGFSFPFLENFEEVLGLFFGRNMTLISYDLPPLEFGFDFSIYVPIWDGLGARFAGGINAVIDLAFGYDTEGMFRFINGGQNPLDLVQGFFIYDDNPFGGFTGIDVPEVEITGRITAAAELNLVVASAGVGGGIFATIGFDLADPDGDFRVRLDEMIANLVNGFEQGVGPLGLFDVDAVIEAKMFAYIEALFGLWRKEFQFGPSLPLFEAHYEVPHDAVLATDLENGTLRLNAGDFAGDRIYTNNGADTPVDGDEEFEVKIISTTEIQVRGRGPDFDEWGDWQTFERDGGFQKITAFAGIGDDSIKVVEDDTGGQVRVEFTGGAGADTLQGGKAADLLVGEGGEDHLLGGDGNDDLQGGTGADCLEGEAGNDTLTADAGNDVVVGGAGNDLAFGGAGDDILAGGDGTDTLLGGDGADLISGGGDADVLLGEAGNDRIWGDLEFAFTDCVLDLASDGDEPALTVPALEGADYIAGGGGSDEIEGNGADDFAWGDSSFKLDASFALQFDAGKPLLTLPLFGNFGADNMSGGAGNDTLYGEAGNDVIRGDNVRVDNEDDDNPFTWAEGDRFSAGTAHGGTDGNDTIYAGRDSDIVFGNGGDDVIAGGTENDILLGNAGNDTITGDVGADAIFGDNGEIQVWLAGDDIDGGAGSAVYGAPTQDFKLLRSYNDAGDGDDTIDAGQDNDIVFGGGGLGLQVGQGAIGQTIEDLVKAGSGDDIVFGDHGRVDFTYSAGAAAAFATNIESVDKDFGGDDQVFGSTGRDVLVGGKGVDFVNGDDGFNPDDPDSRDVVAGDHIQMTQVVTLVTITPNAKVADVYVAAPKRIVSNETAPTQGGDDKLDGRQDDDFLVGGPGADQGTGGVGNDVLLGDRGEIVFDLSFIHADDPAYVFGKGELFVLQTVRSTDLSDPADIPFTGIDHLSGGDGNDVVIGGGRGDFLYGDAELNGAVGPLTATSDILLGDNGQVDYLQHGLLARVTTTDTSNATGGDDAIAGNAGVDIALGGVGGDTIQGDAAVPGTGDGNDILLGDNGVVDFAQDLDLALNATGASPANLATLDLIRSYTDGLGGQDTISGDRGADVVMGGTGDDILFGDNSGATSGAADGRDIMLGDNGTILLVNPALDAVAGGSDRILVRGGAVGLIRSTDEKLLGPNPLVSSDTGGRDRMSGNAGGDIILGGVDGDWLWGDRELPTVAGNALDGNDILLGDNGALEWLSTGRLGELSFNPADPRWNASLPVAFASRNADLDTLDLITTEQPNNGGRDIVFGDNGRDTVFGGTDADTLWGDTGPDALLSAGSVDSAANGNDLLFGDHGRLYAQLGVLSNIHSRDFFAIDIGQSDGGDGDRIWGEEGMDILLGQQGDDRLFGGSDDDDLIGGHNVEGGADELLVGTISVSTGGNLWNDLMDGGSQNDTLAGDNALVWRTGDEVSPRYRTLTGPTLYTTTETTVTVNVDGTARQDPDDMRGRFVFLLDHADGTPAGRSGRDVMAGGSERDVLFGQLGDDLMQGDGMIDATVPTGGVSVTLSVLDAVGLPPGQTGGTLYFRVPEQNSDGDDYLEGNGGADAMFGGLGQDDMIGGSSSLFGLATPQMRPDGSDSMWGGAGIQTARGDLGFLQVSANGADPLNTAAETLASASERGRDADFMLGDNANVWRIVSLDTAAPLGETSYRRYQYDNAAYTGSNPLVVRAAAWLDYTLGGPDFDQDLLLPAVQSTQGNDRGAGDYMHGEAGNDYIHGMTGSDILFGDAHDDDITGGYGHDWISGGTGQDGVIGDDGIIRTSRNSTTGETLFGVAGLLASDPNTKDSNGNVLDEAISTPGNIQVAVINRTGELAKAMDLTPLSVDALWGAVDDEFGYAGQSAQGGAPYADDVIYGGTGSDWLHGGSGDDGISGAEALATFYNLAMAGVPSAGTLGASSVNAGDQLRFNPEDVDGKGPNRQRAGEFALYDEYNPLEEIRVTAANGWDGARVRPGDAGFATATAFFLNFDAGEGVVRPSETVSTNGNKTITTGPVNDDGDDRIFGDTGNDWLVGGTGRDDLYGGWGNDLMNADDRQTTHGSLNDEPDTHSTYEDRAYGGAGRDVLIANTGGDRLIDWVGEWNSYLVPFAPFGMATVSRTLQPQLPEFLYALSRADGADPTIVADGNGSALRNGEPFGELGLVLQKDAAWQDQTGAPADPQAGNIPGGKRDVLRSADFNNSQGQGFVPESGSWTITGGKYEVAPSATSTNKDAISLYFTGEPLPLYFEVAATINAIKPTAGFKANAYVIFDYASPTDFKFAGLNVSTNKIEIGQRASWGFQVLASINAQLKAGQDYNVLLAVNGSAVTFVVDGSQSLSYAFQPRVDALGVSHAIRDGMFGLGGDNARARIDDARVQILPPNFAYVASDDFAQPGGLLQAATGTWVTSGGRLVGTPGAAGSVAIAQNGIAVGANSALQLDARFSLATTASVGGIVFDKYSDTDFKFVAISAATRQILIGHYTERGGWVIDTSVSRPEITTGIDYALGVTLKGSTVSVTLNGATVFSRSYNATVVDGAVGVLARGGAVSFDSFSLKTDDLRIGATTASTLAASSTTTSTSPTTTTALRTADSGTTLLSASLATDSSTSTASTAAGTTSGDASTAHGPWWQSLAGDTAVGAGGGRDGMPATSETQVDGADATSFDTTAAGGGTSVDIGSVPEIDWSSWNAAGVTADGALVDGSGAVPWQEQFVSRLGARAKSTSRNAALYFQL